MKWKSTFLYETALSMFCAKDALLTEQLWVKCVSLGARVTLTNKPCFSTAAEGEEMHEWS